MFKKIAGMIALFLVSLVLLSACGSRADSRLYGRWAGMTTYVSMQFWNYEFRRDGTGRWHDGRPSADLYFENPWTVTAETSFFEIPFTWTVVGESSIEIVLEGNYEPFIYYYEFVDDDNIILRRSTWIDGFNLERLE